MNTDKWRAERQYLEEEIQHLRKERDRYKEMAIAANVDLAKRKVEMLELEVEVERGQKKRTKYSPLNTETAGENATSVKAEPTNGTVGCSSDSDVEVREVGKPGPQRRVRTINMPAKEGLRKHRLSSSPDSEEDHIPKSKAFDYESSPFSRVPYRLNNRAAEKYLRGISKLTIARPVLDQISHDQLIKTFKLPGKSLTYVSDSEGIRFLTPSSRLSPHLPAAPGLGGLLITCHTDMCDGRSWTLLVRDQERRYIYAGEYVLKVAGFVQGQDLDIDHAKKPEDANPIDLRIYHQTKARITFRSRNNEDPTPRDLAHEISRNRKRGVAETITFRSVVKALAEGREKLAVVSMQCQSYDHNRAKEFAALSSKKVSSKQGVLNAIRKKVKPLRSESSESDGGSGKESSEGEVEAPRRGKDDSELDESEGSTSESE